ncbi:class I SAM-dependent methyltransferase [Caldilinea sp.]|uniref:class I SAM-dependent methyltransferase n=1 Tax=Caldilinea sp. TaxID=2293560 RepID=UPI002C2DA7C7|nr:class I SAM-dependent methyltransferase [Caldilinea sp.]
MRQAVQQQLLDLNRRFYATVADEFDRTRQGLPEGMTTLAQILRAQLPAPARILDVGCGNGRLARALAQRGIAGAYLGVDADERLLDLAAAQTADLERLTCRFAQVDLAQENWFMRHDATRYDAIVCLAVLHHFPGYDLRRRLVAEMAGLLTPHGLLALSTWQFLSAPRFAQRLLAWEAIGLSEADVEPGDALLPWNQGAPAVRYVHNLDLEEIERLAAECGLAVVNTFRADGKEGNLNLFVIAQLGAPC